MKLTGRVRSISDFKAHAPDVIRDVAGGRDPVIVTLNGEAKVVVQGIKSYEQTQETLALLKILALGNRDVAAGKYRPVAKAFARVRRRVKR